MRLTWMLGCLLLAAGTVMAEEPAKTGASYRLNFAIHEVQQGKRVNTSAYSLVLEASGANGRLRVGGKQPIKTGIGQSFQYLDMGASIDCKLEERAAGVVLNASVDLSSGDSSASEGVPTVRQMRTEVKAAIPLGKVMRLATLDDVTAKRTYEVDVTATKMGD